MTARGAVVAAARIAVGLAFGYAATTKIGNMRQFAEETANYQILPAVVVPAVAVALVGIETCVAVLLVAGLRVRAAALTAVLLLAVFIGALAQALLRGINLNCGCFGGAEIATWGTVLRDLGLLGVAFVPLALGRE